MTFNLDDSRFLQVKKTLEWKGNGKFGHWESKCELRLYKKLSKTIAILTDLGIGTSVTNSIEHIVSLIHKEYGSNIYINNFEIIEHYLPDSTIEKEETFSKVYLVFNPDEGVFESPVWEPAYPNEIQDILTNTYF